MERIFKASCGKIKRLMKNEKGRTDDDRKSRFI